MRPNENFEMSSEFMYHKKYADTYASLYNRLLNSLKKLDTQFNPTMQKMHKPVIEENHKVMGDTIVVLIVKQKDDRIQWACSMSIYADAGEPETLKEAMTSPNKHLSEFLQYQRCLFL